MVNKFTKKLAFLLVFAMVCSLFYGSEVFAKKKLPYTIEAKNFGNGLSLIRNKKGKYGLVDKKGKIVTNMEYDYIETGIDYGLYLYSTVAKEAKAYKGSERVPGYIVSKGNKQGLLNQKGRLVFALQNKYNIWNRRTCGGAPAIYDFGIPIAYLTKNGEKLFKKYGKQMPDFVLMDKSEQKQGSLHKDGRIGLPFKKLDGGNAEGVISGGFSEKLGLVYFVSGRPRAAFLSWYSDKKLEKKLKKSKWGVYSDKTGKEVVKTIYDEIETMDPAFIQSYFVRKGKKWGIVNEYGKVLKNPMYDDLMIFSTGYYYVKKPRAFVKKGKKWAEVSPKGRVGKFDIDDVYRLKNQSDEQSYGITKNGKAIAYNANGQKVSEVEGEKIDSTNEHFISVRRNGKVGLTDKEGKTLVPFEYEHIQLPKKKDKTVAFVANSVIDKGAYFGLSISEWGLVELGGKVLVKPLYDDISYLELGVYAVGQEGKVGFIDNEGKEILPFVYSGGVEFRTFGEGDEEVGYFLVNKEGKDRRLYGLVDETGKEVLPVEYDYIENFDEDGVAEIKKNGKYGVINSKLEILLPAEYDSIDDLEEGFRKIEKDGKYGYVDKHYKLVLPAEYDSIGYLEEGFRKIEKDGKYGYVDKKYKIVVPAEYDYLGAFEDGKAYALKDGISGYVDENGVFTKEEDSYDEDF